MYGGNGSQHNITGSNVYYAGGGGGGQYSGYAVFAGGQGGGYGGEGGYYDENGAWVDMGGAATGGGGVYGDEAWAGAQQHNYDYDAADAVPMRFVCTRW